jgi:hypothetical protein
VALDSALRIKEPGRNLGIRQVLTERHEYLELSAGDATFSQAIRHQLPRSHQLERHGALDGRLVCGG